MNINPMKKKKKIPNQQKKFPIDNLAEWNHNNNPLGLRSMQVYVLVFDMGNLETFQVSETLNYRKVLSLCNLSYIKLMLLFILTHSHSIADLYESKFYRASLIAILALWSLAINST